MSNYFGANNKGSSNAFGIVTVMDVRVYNFDKDNLNVANPLEFLAQFDGVQPEAVIDHMQVATLSTDGPNVTIQGGKFNNTLIKYGKTARCEMTDALGQADALVALGGAEILDDGSISITDKFGAAKTLIGKTFVVDKETGKHVDATVILYQFLPDSTPSFAFDSGNAATFDLNGDLLAVELTGMQVSGNACGEGKGLFFSIIDDGCAIDSKSKKAVSILYAGSASGVGTAMPGDKVAVTAATGATITAKNLDTGANIAVTDGEFTVPAEDTPVRILVSAYLA